MKGQADRSVWAPLGAPSIDRCEYDLGRCKRGRRRGSSRGRGFRLAPEASAVAAASGDHLSDSESDDEEEDVPLPTPAGARAAFDTRVTTTPLGGDGGDVGEKKQEEVPDEDNHEAGVNLRVGNERSKERRYCSFERDAAIAEVEYVRRRKREKDAEVLVGRMDNIAKEVSTLAAQGVLR